MSATGGINTSHLNVNTIVYSISGGSGSGNISGEGNIFYTKLITNLKKGETAIEPSSGVGSIITITAFNSNGEELFIELRKRNKGFVIYSEIEVTDAPES